VPPFANIKIMQYRAKHSLYWSKDKAIEKILGKCAAELGLVFLKGKFKL